jgi:catechol 2,3-dioxygenase-like lactoylglutathione lyase family enzyme
MTAKSITVSNAADEVLASLRAFADARGAAIETQALQNGVRLRIEGRGLNVYPAKGGGCKVVFDQPDAPLSDEIAVLLGGKPSTTASSSKSADATLSPAIAGAACWIGSDESGKGDYFGPLVVAGLFDRDRHDVRFIDETIEPIDFGEPADLVCLTAMTATAPRAYEIATAFRARGVPTIMGGIHASFCPDEAARYYVGVLGARLLWHHERYGAKVAAVQFRDGDPILLLNDHHPAPRVEPILVVEDAAAAREALAGRGARGLSAVMDGPTGGMATLTDLDGNPLAVVDHSKIDTFLRAVGAASVEPHAVAGHEPRSIREAVTQALWESGPAAGPVIVERARRFFEISLGRLPADVAQPGVILAFKEITAAVRQEREILALYTVASAANESLDLDAVLARALDATLHIELFERSARRRGGRHGR